jgi:hypothetical protein
MSGASEVAEAKAMPAAWRQSEAPAWPGYFSESCHLVDWRLTPTAQNLGKNGQRLCVRPMPGLLCREPGFGYGSVRGNVDEIMFQNRVLAAGIAGLVTGLVVPRIDGGAQESKTAITCTNPVSGASWRIAIDFDNATVDSNRAKITEAKISWFDPMDGGNYTLDRKSGDLTASVASSTGGYFRRGHCSLESSR